MHRGMWCGFGVKGCGGGSFWRGAKGKGKKGVTEDVFRAGDIQRPFLSTGLYGGAESESY